MKKKVTVKICTGTMCYVMGGAELQLLEEHLSAELLEQVEVSGAPCLDFCHKNDDAKAPFVLVNDRVVSEASVSKIVAAINEELENCNI